MNEKHRSRNFAEWTFTNPDYWTWANLLGEVASRSSCPKNCFEQTPKQCQDWNSFTSRRAQHYYYWRSKFGGNGLFPIQFAVTSLHHTPSWRNMWILVRNFSFYIDIHTPLWKTPTLLSLLWYSALVRWRHNRRPRNYRFIQWGSKTDAKKRHFPNEFRKMLSQDFYWVIEDCFSLLLLRIGRYGFLHRSAPLRRHAVTERSHCDSVDFSSGLTAAVLRDLDEHEH